MKFPPPELVAEIHQLLQGKEEAIRFVIAYGQYVEHIDDLVDEPKSIPLIQTTILEAADIFSSNYWRRNGDYLRITEKLINLEYFDSVAWEAAANEEWKRRDARVMSHAAYHMLFAILLLECGDDATRKICLRFREQAHLKHLHDEPALRCVS